MCECTCMGVCAVFIEARIDTHPPKCAHRHIQMDTYRLERSTRVHAHGRADAFRTTQAHRHGQHIQGSTYGPQHAHSARTREAERTLKPCKEWGVVECPL